jgi:hypothetical protein
MCPVAEDSARTGAGSPGRDGSSVPDSDPGAASGAATPGPVQAAVGAAFGALSRLRGARIFHPQGVGYTAVMRVEEREARYSGVPLLERAGEHPALVRFSRAAGLPEVLPDALGLAVRLVDVHGTGRHQDFLLVTSADGPLFHHLLLPGVGGFFGQSFSSLLLYRVGRELRLVGATPATRPRAREGRGGLRDVVRVADRGELVFQLALAPLMGRLAPVADLEVRDRMPDDETERLAFNPWNTGGGIRPTGPLMGLRQSAYRGSQEARGLQPTEIP